MKAFVVAALLTVASAACSSGRCGSNGQGNILLEKLGFAESQTLRDSSADCPSSYMLPIIQDAAYYTSGAQNQNNYIYNKLRDLYPNNNYVIDVVQQNVEWYANTFHCNDERCRYDTQQYTYLVYRSSGSCCNM